MELTQNAIWILYHAEERKNYTPILQVMYAEHMQNMLFKIEISDGTYKTYCIISSNLYNTVNSKVLPHSIIQLLQYSILYIQSIPALLVKDLKFIKLLPHIIGNPKLYLHSNQALTHNSPSSTTTKKFEILRNGGMRLNKSSHKSLQPVIPQIKSKLDNKEMNYTPIPSLIQSNQDWVIKARIYFKTRLFDNFLPRSNGKMFQICILDKWGETECRFSDKCVELYDRLEVGKVYTFSHGVVSTGKYTHIAMGLNIYITFKHTSDIRIQPDDPSIPSIRYSFTKILNLHSMNQCIVDILAVIVNISNLITFTNQAKETKFRFITVMDDSESCIQIKIWNETAEMDIFNSLPSNSRTMILLKNARVNLYHTSKQLSVFQVTDILLNPIIPEASTLSNWIHKKKFRMQGLDLTYKDLPCIPSTLYDIKHTWSTKLLNNSPKVIFILHICIGYIKDYEKFDLIHETCSQSDCRRRLIIGTGQKYYCLKCRKYYEECEYSYGISCKIYDNSDCVYAMAYNNAGEVIYGMTANEFNFLEIQDDPEDYREVLTRGKNKYYMAHVAVCKREDRLSYVIEKLSDVDPAQTLGFYTAELMDIIQEYHIYT